LALPEGVDTSKITADYHNGVLEITAPISAAALPRRVEIRGGSQLRQMAAGSGS
jgi:HSP20 family protein